MPQELGVLAIFLVVFLFDTFFVKDSNDKSIAILTPVLFAAYTVWNFVMPINCGLCFDGMYEQTMATFMMKNILNIGMLIVLIQAYDWANSSFMAVRRGEFYELLLLTLLGMDLMIGSRHFLLFVVGLETASLPLAALVAFDKKYYVSHEAAAKYILTAVFSSAVFLLGLSFLYGVGGSLYFNDLAYSIMGNCSPMLIVALGFVIAGIGFKLSLVPFHLWTADVYQGAPTSVTAYLSVISKGAAAYAFLVILCQVFGSAYSQVWEWMLYVLIVLTITIGNLFAIRQKNMKRFLAFSSISQAGYIMLGVIAANVLGMTSVMYYVLVYIFSNLGAFGVIAAIERFSGRVTMDDYNGLFKTNPWLSFVMMLAMFSLAGIPPFAGFVSKFFIFVGALNTGSVAIYILVLIALINTIVSLFYYLLVVKAMFIKNDDCVIENFKSTLSERLGMFICTLGIILLGIASVVYTVLYDASEASSAVYGLIG